MRLHARLAYVMRVDVHASVAYAAASARSAWAVQWGHDAHKASTRRQHARLGYVMHVDNRASVAYAAAPFRPRPRFNNF
jgi:hypothetical protein